MNSRNPDRAEKEMMTRACDFCGAPPNQWCKTPKGRDTGYLHAARYWEWRNPPEPDPATWPPVAPEVES